MRKQLTKGPAKDEIDLSLTLHAPDGMPAAKFH